MHRYLLSNTLFMVLMDKAGDPPGGGGDPGKGGDDPAKQISELQASNKALLERLDKLEKAAKKDDPEDDPDLDDKAKKEREAKDKSKSDQKAIENALKFSLGAKDWLKTNASLLPKDIEGIFDAAEKETYDSALAKDSAIKSAVVKSFFSVQSNVDLLTPSQKSALEEFLKLTNTGRQEKASQLYDQVFEPTFEMLKRLKKAEQLRQDGHSTGSDVETAYRERMMKLSNQHYNVGEKKHA